MEYWLLSKGTQFNDSLPYYHTSSEHPKNHYCSSRKESFLKKSWVANHIRMPLNSTPFSVFYMCSFGLLLTAVCECLEVLPDACEPPSNNSNCSYTHCCCDQPSLGTGLTQSTKQLDTSSALRYTGSQHYGRRSQLSACHASLKHHSPLNAF